MLQLITKGGFIMWPLLVCSAVALTVILERTFFWVITSLKTDKKSINKIFELTDKGDFESAIKVGSDSKCMTCRILTAGVAHRNYGLTENLEAAAGAEIARMKRGLNILDTIITIAPLLGILGTVSGIILSFDLLGDSGIEDPKAVTGGIAQALITTAAGLTISIITLIPYNALVSKIETVTHYFEKMCTCYAITVQKGEELRAEKKKTK